MDPDSYHRLSAETWRDSDPEPQQVSHAVHGFSEEVGEYVSSRGVDELGDAVYYYETVRRLIGAGPADYDAGVLSQRGTGAGLRIASDMSGVLVPWLFRDDGIGRDRAEGRLAPITQRAAMWALRECASNAWAIGEVMRRNVEKLEDRHGGEAP